LKEKTTLLEINRVEKNHPAAVDKLINEEVKCTIRKRDLVMNGDIVLK
jgi:hypothetical protein